MKEVCIEYAHIYTKDKISEDQDLSVSILKDIKVENASLVIMVDDYSFPDPSFDYDLFSKWLEDKGFKPDIILRESQLIPLCDEVINLIEEGDLKQEISDYIRSKKYPCSLFISAWYLLRLGKIKANFFGEEYVAKRLINILPKSFEPFEIKALEIIKSTMFKDSAEFIDYRYFEGRKI